MNPFAPSTTAVAAATTHEGWGSIPFDPDHLITVGGRMMLALVLGGLLAYRPWRRLLGRPATPVDTAQAQTLIAVAGTILVTMIGDSVARAFGLVGLGGFIRFRSGIKDPRDAAVMFVSIGIGMACGMGLEPIAVVTAVFVSVLLVVFDLTSAPRRARVRLALVDAARALPQLRRVLPSLRVITLPTGASPEPQDLVVEVDATHAADASALHDEITRAGGLALHAVEVLDD